jgi:membrane protease YdiL (CAAX protease family)
VTTPPAPDPSAPAPPTRSRLTLREVFFGPEGLRAGWSILLYASLIYSLAIFLSPLAHLLQPRPAPPAQQTSTHATAELTLPSDVILSDGFHLTLVVFVTWTMSRIERRPISVYGTTPRRAIPNLFAGLLWGLALLSLLVLTLHAAGLLVFDARLLFGLAALRYAAIWLIAFLLVASFEEYLTRGYLQFTLARGLAGILRRARAPHPEALAFFAAALPTSFIFSLGHTDNPGESPIGLIAAALIGLLFCLSLWRTGSLWWAIGFHTSWDWAQSFLFGVADSGGVAQGRLFATHPVGRPILSGGLTGPEGSLFILPILALTAAVILLTLPRTPHQTHSGYPAADPPSPSLN